MKYHECRVDGCIRVTAYKTTCPKHWYQINKFGKPVETMFDQRELVDRGEYFDVPLWGKDAVVGYAKVDKDCDWIASYKWGLSDKGYARTLKNGKVLRMHRLILDANRSEQVDHKNLDRLDNRRQNLRLSTPTENNANKNKQSNNTSGYKGVFKRGSRWVAFVNKNRKRYWLGTYDTPSEAAVAYNERASELFGEFARLNITKENT